jgi:hypothetical protein
MSYQIEHLRLDLAQLSVPAKFEAIEIQLKFAKGQNHAQSPVYALPIMLPPRRP